MNTDSVYNSQRDKTSSFVHLPPAAQSYGDAHILRRPMNSVRDAKKQLITLHYTQYIIDILFKS